MTLFKKDGRVGRWLVFMMTGLVSVIANSAIGESPKVRVADVRRVFDNGEHNAFTDLVKWKGIVC